MVRAPPGGHISTVATLRQTGAGSSGTAQQNAIVIPLAAAPTLGDALVAYVTGSASAGALAPPDNTWHVLDAQITTPNGLVAASFWKIAGSSEPTSYTFTAGTGNANDYCSGAIFEVAVTGTTPIDLHVFTNGTISGPSEASTPTVASPTIGDVVVAAIATQAGSDSAGYGAQPTPGWNIDRAAAPRANATILAHLTNLASDTSTPESFAIAPGASGGDFIGFLTFVRPSSSGTSGGGQTAFVAGDIIRNDANVIARAATSTQPATVQLTATPPSGGSGAGSYTYQWYRSTTIPFTPSNATALSGQTMLALNDQTVVAGTRYAYVLVTTDRSAPPNVATTLPQVVVVPSSTLYVGYIGDGAGFGIGTTLVSAVSAAQNAIAASLATIIAPAVVGSDNRSVPQTATRDWLPGGALLGPAIADFNSKGVGYVIIALGTEDSRDDIATSSTDFIANLRAICSYILAEIPGIKILVNFPASIDVSRAQAPFSVASLGRLASYLTVFPTLGTTGLVGLVLGDTNAYAFFTQSMFDTLGTDGVHPNDSGAAALGALWAKAFIAATIGAWSGVVSSTGKFPVAAPNVTLSFPTT